MALPATASLTIGGFDATRGGGFCLTNGSYLNGLRSALASAFPNAQLVVTDTLTSDFLSGVDVVLLCSPTGSNSATTPLTTDEQAALIAFVQSGKGALLYVDNDTFAGSGTSAVNNSFVAPFGVHVTGTLNGWPFNVTVQNPASSPVTQGYFGTVSSYSVGWPGWFDSLGSNATGLATIDANSQTSLAVVPYGLLGAGSGPAVLFSDSTTIVDGYFDANAAMLAENAFDYAAGPFDSLVLASASIQGGKKDKGTATLRHPAPAGNVTVTFTSSNPSVAKVTKQKVVKKGKTVAKFSVKTKHVKTVTTVVITATAFGISRSTTLTVHP